MKDDALQVSGSVVSDPSNIVQAPSTQPDPTTRLLTHPEVQSLGRKGGLSAREKALVLTASHITEAEMYERYRNSGPERIAKAMFLQRWFAPLFGTPADSRPKSLWERMGIALPVLAAVMLALATWKTAETASWKATAEARKETIETQKDQLKQAHQKNDDLQGDLNNISKDQKTDIETLRRQIQQLQSKYPAPTAHKQSAPSAGATPGQ